MQYLLCLAVAIMLVAGQSLWKLGVMQMQIDPHAVLIKKALIVATNPYILGGGFIYVVATVFYMYVISYYEYATSYAVIVGLSLIIAAFVASWLFSEKISLVNMLGFAVIIVGVFLVLKK